MRTINPAAKLTGLLFITFFLAYKMSVLWNITIFIFCLIAMIFSRVDKVKLMLILVPVFLAALGMFFTGYHFSTGGAMPVRNDIVSIENSAILNGMTLAARVLAYGALGTVFALTTDRILLIKSFQAQFKLPQVFAYGLLAAWGVFPYMIQEYNQTRAAFRSRGIRAAPFSPALLQQLLIKAVRWSEELSIAMESKGFSAKAHRSDYNPVILKRCDAFFILVTCLVIPAMIICF